MEELIRRVFVRVEVIGPLVAEGRYDPVVTTTWGYNHAAGLGSCSRNQVSS